MVDCGATALHASAKAGALLDPVAQIFGTDGICVGGTTGLIFGVDGSVRLVHDRNGHVGVAVTGGGGPELLATGGASVSVLVSNADNIDQLTGRSGYVGASGGEGPTAGGEVGFGTEAHCGPPLITLNAGIGVGLDLSQYGPIEEHAGLSKTKVFKIF